MSERNYNTLLDGEKLIAKLWNKHVTIEDAAIKQIRETASMPFVKPYVAVMPDSHFGMGATVGSVVPTVSAICPASVGVDIGCGMMTVRTNLKPSLNDFDAITEQAAYRNMFDLISAAVPHGRTDNGGANDRGAWGEIPKDIQEIFGEEISPYIYGEKRGVFDRHSQALSKNAGKQLGTLGTGNHFIEVCREITEHWQPEGNLWVVIHSGSRGFGNRIGTYFTKLSGELCKKWSIALPNKDLGYLPEGTQEYDDYLTALALAQRFSWRNREIMMARVLKAIGADESAPYIAHEVPSTIHMHHNYMAKYHIGGQPVNLTRKGAVDASKGNWVIIPGSMGAKTYIGRGLGNPESFDSCSHGAGRAMSRTQALKQFTLEEHAEATKGVVCDKTRGVLDETPASYKDIDAVMESQRDLVEPVLKLKQLLCVKGISE